MPAQIPSIDLSGESHRRVVVDQVDGQYLGQPDTVLLRDERSILVAYPLGHGGPDTALKRSVDGGLTWSDRLPVPPSFAGRHNAPTIHRVTDPRGVERLLLVVSYPRMVQSLSEDDGQTWTPLTPLFPETRRGRPGFKGHAPPKSVIPIAGSRYLALYHDHFEAGAATVVAPMQITSTDGGLTWSAPRRIGHHPRFPGAQPCEPALIRSPDGRQLLCLLRENSRQYGSLKMTSEDEGEGWSEIDALPPVLTGDRHIARYAPDGRLVVTYRDTGPDSPTCGDFVGWVGAYEDLIAKRSGQCRLRLLANRGRPGDTGYAGLELLPDGTFVSTTYCALEEGRQPLVVSLRFTMEEIDDRLP
jgi:hypothetical protein